MPDTTTATPAPPAFPPYGHVNALYGWDDLTRGMPDRFCTDGRPATFKEWDDFVESVVTELSNILWPRWKAGAWDGDAKGSMLDLTRADLALMNGALKGKLLTPVGTESPLKKFTHKAMFEDEDEGRPGLLYPTLDPYVENLDPETLVKLKEDIKKNVVGFGGAALKFKMQLQRPRPCQASFVLGEPLSFELARSSMTPSMLSGHCLTGLVCRCASYVTYRLPLEKAANAAAGFQQHMVDIGDRRVFAGVHYPSDSLASWWCAMKLCDRLYGAAGAAVKAFMADAIRTRSAVFTAIEAAVKADPKSPYDKPMKLLATEMKRTAVVPVSAEPATETATA